MHGQSSFIYEYKLVSLETCARKKAVPEKEQVREAHIGKTFKQ